MGLESGKAGGLQRQRGLFELLCFLLSAFLDLRGLGGLRRLRGFQSLVGFGGFGAFLPGFRLALGQNLSWGHGLLGV